MKLRKILSAACALAMAVSAAAITTVTSSAVFDPEGHIICILSNDSNPATAAAAKSVTPVEGLVVVAPATVPLGLLVVSLLGLLVVPLLGLLVVS